MIRISCKISDINLFKKKKKRWDFDNSVNYFWELHYTLFSHKHATWEGNKYLLRK